LTKVIIWATVEEVVAMVVANAPILRPLFFRGKNFESSASNNVTTGHNGTRTYTNHGGTLHDIYEMTSDKGIGNTVSVVSAGDANFKRSGFPRPGDKSARSAAPTTQDTFGVLRTVEVMVHSEETHKKGRKGDEDGSSSNSSLWMP